jgi:hypothetical protein
MENPRAKLRRLMELYEPAVPRVEVAYCRYERGPDGGLPAMKPTDLWGVWPNGWKPRPMCQNRNPDHISAPAGSDTGTQGSGRGDSSAERALWPYALGEDICVALERELGEAGRPSGIVPVRLGQPRLEMF